MDEKKTEQIRASLEAELGRAMTDEERIALVLDVIVCRRDTDEMALIITTLARTIGDVRGESNIQGRALAMARTKLDESRLWLAEYVAAVEGGL